MDEGINKLESELKRLPSPVELLFHGKAEDAFSTELEGYLRALCGASGGRLTLAEADEPAVPFRPAFTLKAGGRDNLHYLAIPSYNETAPFARALRSVSRGEATVDRRAAEALEAVSSPAELWVFVSPLCTQCPKVVETAVALAVVSPWLATSIIDVERFAASARAYGVQSVPATLIDRELVLVGRIDAERLSTLLAQRGQEGYERELLRSLIGRGRASEAAERLRRGRARRALLSLFEEPDFSLRLGVLVALGIAREQRPRVVREMVPALIGLLSHEDARVRGDIADFLGETGDARAVPHLERLRKDANADVVEAACDALERLRGSARAG